MLIEPTDQFETVRRPVDQGCPIVFHRAARRWARRGPWPGEGGHRVERVRARPGPARFPRRVNELLRPDGILIIDNQDWYNVIQDLQITRSTTSICGTTPPRPCHGCWASMTCWSLASTGYRCMAGRSARSRCRRKQTCKAARCGWPLSSGSLSPVPSGRPDLRGHRTDPGYIPGELRADARPDVRV